MTVLTSPLLVFDRDGYLYLFESPEDLSAYLEAVHVEEDEYTAFDGAARPVRLVVIDGAVRVQPTTAPAEEEELRRRVAQHFTRYARQTPAPAAPGLEEFLRQCVDRWGYN